MTLVSPVPATQKIRQRLERLARGVNFFERELGLSPGVGSRILRGEYRPKVAVVLRIEAWSQGEVSPEDWLTPEETARLRAARAESTTEAAA